MKTTKPKVHPHPAGDEPRMLAAVDLGSNSFRMVIARVVGEGLQMVDRLREGVRLAGSLDRRRRITVEGRQRALHCLRMFGQRLRDLPPGSVRAVGTNTLRQAKNTEDFLEDAEDALGHPIEVISGQEEARLIFLGASHSLSGTAERRLVVDIGGGSTECIVGESFEPLRTESLYMGCVSMTRKFFPKGRITPKRILRAETAARLEMRPVKADFRQLGWQRAIGTSGTIHAVHGILLQNGWSEQAISPAGLERLRQVLLATNDVESLNLQGLRRDRARVLPGGVAILTAVFDSLRIESMSVASGALREGVLYDLLGRIRHEDVRDRTIQRFIKQYNVDTEQAGRVAATALYNLGQVEASWKLDTEFCRSYLRWSADLHEIGLAIAHGGYHKHSAYLIDHSNMPGFSYQDQQMLSLLTRSVRRKFPRELFAELPKGRGRLALRLSILLRLAVLFNRSRSQRALPEFQLVGKGRKLLLKLPKAWLAEHPLTRADLQQEKSYLESVGYQLKLGTHG